MASRNRPYDNELLVEFEFLVDLDIAMFYFIKENYYSSEFANKRFLSLSNYIDIAAKLIDREHINPLELIFPNNDVTELYNDLLNKYEYKLLPYAKPYDTFYLMNTFIKNGSSVKIDALCNNENEKKFLIAHNSMVNDIIVQPDRQKINLDNYTAIYLKYFARALQYQNIAGKHIYIANAKWNYDDGRDTIDTPLAMLFGDVNIVKLMDLYTRLKFRYTHNDEVLEESEEDINDNQDSNREGNRSENYKEEESDDSFEYSTGDGSTSDSDGYAWYNF